jgi:chromosome segregation ATPase
MTQTFWESEEAAAAGQNQPQSAGQDTDFVPEQLQAGAPAAETKSAVALSADEFSALEERILRAVELVKSERRQRLAVESRLAEQEVQLREQNTLVESIQKDMEVLRGERDQVRQRIERLLAQLDSLEL